VMKGQPISCNSQPTRVKFEIPEHGRSWAEEKEGKKHCCLKDCSNPRQSW
jgi:hypothetical protein